MNKKLIFQLIYVVALLLLFYYLNFSIYFLLVVGLFFILIIFLKGKIYKSINNFASEQIPLLKKFPNWIQKLIIIIVFILIYILIKEIIFFILNLIGIDVRGMLINSINQSFAN